MESAKARGPQSVAYYAGALVLVYFLFPHLLLMPYVLIAGKSHTPPEWLRVVFWPVSKLSDRVPAYRALLQTESDLTGIH